MGGDQAGMTSSTTSAPSATTATDTGQAWTTNQWAGHMVTLGSTYGVIVSNTATVLTVDRWYTPSSPGGAAASTPGTGVYIILPGNAPQWYMAITANATAPSATDTSLTGEITTAGGGLVRKLGTVAHTTGVAGYSVAATFTANGSDSLPVTVAKMGIFNSIVGATGRMQFETLLATTATLSASGDSLTITDSISN